MIAEPQVRQLLSDLVQHIVSGYRPERIVLFGSYAYGQPDADSDIDLLIIKETPKKSSHAGRSYMDESSQSIAAAWFERADEDLKVARHLFDQGFALFRAASLLQQAVERYLKGYLLSVDWALKNVNSDLTPDEVKASLHAAEWLIELIVRKSASTR